MTVVRRLRCRVQQRAPSCHVLLLDSNNAVVVAVVDVKVGAEVKADRKAAAPAEAVHKVVVAVAVRKVVVAVAVPHPVQALHKGQGRVQTARVSAIASDIIKNALLILGGRFL